MGDIVCRSCGAVPGPTTFIAPLHGKKGGPLMCVPCGQNWYARRERRHDPFKTFFGSMSAEPTELSLELLTEALALTHPDAHPPERKARAQRVTAELSALKAHVLPKPKPVPVTDALQSLGGTAEYPSLVMVRPDFPCEDCCGEAPMDYCDACRATWDAHQAEKRAEESAKARQRRARKRAKWRAVCATCEKVFQPTRRDAMYCCAAHRQSAHRHRVTAKNMSRPATDNSRNERVPHG